MDMSLPQSNWFMVTFEVPNYVLYLFPILKKYFATGLMPDVRDFMGIHFLAYKIYCFTESNYFLKFYVPDLQLNYLFQIPLNFS